MTIAVFFEEPNYSLEDLQVKLDSLSLETNFINNAIHYLSSYLPSFRKNIEEKKNVIDNYVDDIKYEIDIKLPSYMNKAVKKLYSMSYSNFGERTISVPENFSGNLLQYANTLLEVNKEINDIKKILIPDYITILSSFITNKDAKMSLRSHEDVFKKIKNQREESFKKLKTYFPSNTGNSKIKFKNVFNRFTEVDMFFKHATMLAKVQNKNNLKEIQRSVNNITDSLDVIISYLQKGEITNVTPEVTSNLSTGAYEVARFIELYSLVYFDIMVLCNKANDLAQSITDYPE